MSLHATEQAQGPLTYPTMSPMPSKAALRRASSAGIAAAAGTTITRSSGNCYIWKEVLTECLLFGPQFRLPVGVPVLEQFLRGIRWTVGVSGCTDWLSGHQAAQNCQLCASPEPVRIFYPHKITGVPTTIRDNMHDNCVAAAFRPILLSPKGG